MKKQIVINASKDRSRIAIVEDGELVELYVENPDNVRTLGNIYLGKVQKVMPALRAAFVDVGLKQDAFLHFSDLTDNAPQLLAMAGETVPGLDAPLLSLAPSKRIAEDDAEPDVEDTLEVEEAEAPKSRTASRRRRGGRGRTRPDGARAEEEEEQEEAGEQRKRRGPLVIDLTSKPTRPAPRPTRPSVVADEPVSVAATPAPVAAAEPAPNGASEPTEAPAPERSRRRTRGSAVSDAPVADVPGADVPDVPSLPDVPDADDLEAAPARRATTDPSDIDKTDDDDDLRGRRRGSRGRGRGGRGDAADAATPGTDGAPEAALDTRNALAESPTDVPTTEASDASVAEPRPAARRRDDAADGRRSGRGQELDAAREEDEDAPPAARAPRRAEDPGRRRVDALLDIALGDLTAPVPRRAPLRLDDEEDAPDADSDAPAARPGAPSARGRHDDARPDDDRTPRSRRRSDADRPRDDEETPIARPADAADDRPDGDPDRSRRRSRGGRRDAEPTGTDTAGATETAPRLPDAEPRGRRAPADPDRTRTPRPERGDSSRNDASRSDPRSAAPRSEARPAPRPTGGKIPPTEELLRRDGRVLVKITKEPISAKGSRVSTDLSLAGRFLVLVPAADYVAVSKKIESAKERRRLRTLAQSLKPEGFGVIVRTVAEGRDAKSLDTDLRLLADKWRRIEQQLAAKPQPPVLLYEDVNMVSSIIRDLFSDDYDRILVDDPKVFKNVQAYVKAVAPQMADKVELHRAPTPVFRAVGIETQVEEAFSKRVNMRGGGYLFIETTEAMHVVDVNSGRAGRGKSQKENMLAVNVEAAREVAKQLRLRDLGGIIVVDFIDLKYDRDRKKVADVLKEAFAKDRAVTKLLPMSDFGLVQITRQRLRPSITTQTDEDGEPLGAEARARAAGAGEIAQPERRGGRADDDRYDDDARVETPRSEAVEPAISADDATPEKLAAAVRGWLVRYRTAVDERYKRRPILVRVHPLLGAHLRRGLISPIARWKLSLRGIPFQLQDDAALHPLAFDVRDEKSGRSLLKKYV